MSFLVVVAGALLAALVVSLGVVAPMWAVAVVRERRNPTFPLFDAHRREQADAARLREAA